MRRVPTPRQLATGTIGASLCSVLATLVASRTYSQPDPDGTSLAGLAFAMLLAFGLLSLGSGGLLAVHTRWGESGTWPRRLLYSGAGAGAVASVVVILWSGVSQIPETSTLGRLIAPVGTVFLGVTTVAAVTILLCAVLGVLMQVVRTITTHS